MILTIVIRYIHIFKTELIINIYITMEDTYIKRQHIECIKKCIDTEMYWRVQICFVTRSIIRSQNGIVKSKQD